MSDPADRFDYYQVLEITPVASADEIRTAFHRFAREHHPDNFVGSPEEAARHTERYRLGSEAYRILLDPMKRKLYNEGLEKGLLRYSEDRAEEKRRTIRAPGGVTLALRQGTGVLLARSSSDPVRGLGSSKAQSQNGDSERAGQRRPEGQARRSSRTDEVGLVW